MTKKKQQLAAMILNYILCFSLLNCSKQEQKQVRSVEGEQKSLAESQGQSSGGNEKQSSNTDVSFSTTGKDSLADAFEPVPAPFGFIHKDSLQHYSKALVRKAYFKDGYSGVSQEDFSINFDEWVYHEFFLNLPYRNLILSMHWWYGEGDTPTGVITFWQPKGDSLQFIPLEEKSYLDFWGKETIADSMSYTGGAFLLVLNGETGDSGDIWGYYDILRFQKNKPIKHLSHEDYDYENDIYAMADSINTTYTTLKCEIVREENIAFKVRHIRDSFADMRNNKDQLLKSDTTYATFH